MNLDSLRRFVVFLSILVYVLSLTQDAIVYEDIDGEKVESSFSLLFMGALALMDGGLQEWLVWLANPLYLFALFFLNKDDKRAAGFSRVAFFIALSFVLWNEILVSEDGRTAVISSLESGYYLWVLSIAILSVGSVFYFKKSEASKQNQT